MSDPSKESKGASLSEIFSGFLVQGVAFVAAGPLVTIKLRRQLKAEPASEWSDYWRETPFQLIRYPARFLVHALLRGRVQRSMRHCFYEGASPRLGSFLSSIALGSATAAASLAFLYPLEAWRTHAAIGEALPTDPRQLYKGFWVSVAGIVAYRVAYFGLYRLASRLPRPTHHLHAFALGVGVTVAAAVLTYPLDTIRRTQMVSELDRSALEVGRELYASGDLWNGVLFALARATAGVVAMHTFTQFMASRTRQC